MARAKTLYGNRVIISSLNKSISRWPEPPSIWSVASRYPHPGAVEAVEGAPPCLSHPLSVVWSLCRDDSTDRCSRHRGVSRRQLCRRWWLSVPQSPIEVGRLLPRLVMWDWNETICCYWFGSVTIRPLHGPPFAGRTSFSSRKASNWRPNMLHSACTIFKVTGFEKKWSNH